MNPSDSRGINEATEYRNRGDENLNTLSSAFSNKHPIN